ncbi:hypothetical protein D3C81_1156950 [compost metagenome]
MGADHQDLDPLEHLQGIDQPVDPRVETPPAFFLCAVALGLECHFGIQLGMLAQRQLHVLIGAWQRIRMQIALREALDGGTRVAEQDAAGAVAIEQFANQACAGLGITVVDSGQQGLAFSTEETFDGGVGFGRQATFVEQLLDCFGHRAIVLALGAESGQVMETVWIEQAQAGEVAVLAQLFRRRGQQQYTRNNLGQLLDQQIFRAGLFFMPDQVMGFVDHQQVPAGGKQRVLGLFVFAQPLQGDQRQLGILKRVAGIAFDKALGVEQGDLQVEAPAHFYQPLVLQVLWNQDQYTAGTAGEQLTMDHQARFDGFAQAHFVRQQYPRGNTVGYFASDMQLVGNRLGTGAAQAPQ